MMAFCRKVFQCHQLPERSFFFRGMQFPICARCTGIVLGLLLGPLPCAFGLYNVCFSLMLASILVIDGYTQLKGWRKSTNTLRFLSGLLFGYSLVSFVFAFVSLFVR